MRADYDRPRQFILRLKGHNHPRRQPIRSAVFVCRNGAATVSLRNARRKAGRTSSRRTARPSSSTRSTLSGRTPRDIVRSAASPSPLNSRTEQISPVEKERGNLDPSSAHAHQRARVSGVAGLPIHNLRQQRLVPAAALARDPRLVPRAGVRDDGVTDLLGAASGHLPHQKPPSQPQPITSASGWSGPCV